jgi:hypothetical protein
MVRDDNANVFRRIEKSPRRIKHLHSTPFNRTHSCSVEDAVSHAGENNHSSQKAETLVAEHPLALLFFRGVLGLENSADTTDQWNGDHPVEVGSRRTVQSLRCNAHFVTISKLQRVLCQCSYSAVERIAKVLERNEHQVGF